MYQFLRFSILTTCLIITAFNFTNADPSKEHNIDHMKPYTGSAELEKIKSLSGTWTGMSMVQGQEVPMTVVYKTTAGGSAVIETLSPGTPMEMISIYSEDDGKLVMRHFCMLKNQPVLGVKSVGENTIEFELIDGTNMDASKDMHMHSAVFTFIDDNTMKQTWIPYQDGKASEDGSSITLRKAQ